MGITPGAQGDIQVIAPWGLDDLFGIVVRRNPSHVSLQTFRQRIDKTRDAQRWPKV